jgi:hypothetical protein
VRQPNGRRVDVVDYPLGYLAYEADRDYFEVGPRDGKKPEVGTMTAADPRPSGQQGGNRAEAPPTADYSFISLGRHLCLDCYWPVAASRTDGNVHRSSVNVPGPTVQTGWLGHCHRRLVDPLIVSDAQAQSQAGPTAHKPRLLLQDRHAVGPVQYEPATEQGEKPTGADVHAPPSAVERAAEPHATPRVRLRRIKDRRRGM